MSAEATVAAPENPPLPAWAQSWDEPWEQHEGQIRRHAWYDAGDVTASQDFEWRDGQVVPNEAIEVLLYGYVNHFADDQGTAIDSAIRDVASTLADLVRLKARVDEVPDRAWGDADDEGLSVCDLRPDSPFGVLIGSHDHGATVGAPVIACDLPGDIQTAQQARDLALDLFLAAGVLDALNGESGG
ncbi:hypothetical protein [Demequina sp.]|uniref:hypothetical protein n=1 Tax=Demequina sp. TaxID=2050685 RepID=UPI003D0F1BFA